MVIKRVLNLPQPLLVPSHSVIVLDFGFLPLKVELLVLLIKLMPCHINFGVKSGAVICKVLAF
jgi:hypothetical protein